MNKFASISLKFYATLGFIRSSDSSFEQLAEKISRDKDVTVNGKQIEKLFEQHGLKKTMQIAVPVL